MAPGLVEDLPRGLEKALAETLAPDERVEVKLKGAFKEGLVCTDGRVMVLKAGFMTGQTFGVNVFQLAYPAVTSADVKFNLLSGYFELSAGGVQSTQKTYWDVSNHSPTKSPNCISLTDRKTAQRFREACTFITTKVAASRQPVTPPASGNVIDALERLAALHASGALTADEFGAAKAKLLSTSG